MPEQVNRATISRITERPLDGLLTSLQRLADDPYADEYFITPEQMSLLYKLRMGYDAAWDSHEAQAAEIARLRTYLSQIVSQPTQQRNYSIALDRCIEIAKEAVGESQGAQQR